MFRLDRLWAGIIESSTLDPPHLHCSFLSVSAESAFISTRKSSLRKDSTPKGLIMSKHVDAGREKLLALVAVTQYKALEAHMGDTHIHSLQIPPSGCASHLNK